MKSNLMFLKHKPLSYFQFYLNYQVQLVLLVSHIGTSVCKNPYHLARMQDLQ